MKKIILYSISMLFISSSYSAVISTNELLKIQPGTIAKGLATSGETKESSYEMEVVDNKVVSISINFNSPRAADQYLTKNAKGFCLVQSASGDLLHNRLFFFNKELTHRYEINESSKIKSILVQDIPGARANRECEFNELVKLGKPDQKVMRVK